MDYNKSNLPFTSILGNLLNQYIDYKRSNGYQYGQSYCSLVKKFDKYINSIELSEISISTEVIENWLKMASHLNPSTYNKYYDFICDFINFMIINGYENIHASYEFKRRKLDHKYIPYIYDDEDINNIFSYLIEKINRFPQVKIHKTIFMLICLYYGCGLRKSEALNIKLSDLNKADRTLTIYASKNNVSRIIPLSDSIYNQLVKYIEITKYKSINDYIFIDSNCKHFSDKSLYNYFHNLIDELGIIQTSNGNRPRIHDFRHTFCVNVLKNTEENGTDSNAIIPVLSAYLGHKGIIETEYYLRLIPKEEQKILDKSSSYVSNLYQNKEIYYEKNR